MAPGFTVLDDETARALLREAIDATLLEATDGSSPAQRQALEAVIPYAAEDRFDDVLRTALGRRRWLDSATRIDFGEHEDELAGLEAAYRRAFKVRADVTVEDIDSDMADVIGDAELARVRDALSGGSANDLKMGEKVIAALAAPSSAARAAALEGFFCTDGKARKSLMTKGIAAAHADLDAALVHGADALRAPRRGASRPARHQRDDRPASAGRRGAAALHARQGAPRRARLRGSHFQERLPARRAGAGVVGDVQARPRHRPHPRRRGPGHEPRAVADRQGAGVGVLRRCRRAQRNAHAVRRRRREAVDLQLPGRRPSAVRRHGQGLRADGEGRRAHLAAHPARSVVPHRVAGARRGRQRVRRPRPHAGPVERSRHRAPCGASPGPWRRRRGVADGGRRRHRQRRPVDAARRERRARAGRAAGRAHRRHHPRLARQRRDAGVGRAPHHAPATSSSWCASAARLRGRWWPP